MAFQVDAVKRMRSGRPRSTASRIAPSSAARNVRLLPVPGDLNHIQHENRAKSPLTNSSQKTSSILFCAQTSHRAWAGGPPSSRPSAETALSVPFAHIDDRNPRRFSKTGVEVSAAAAHFYIAQAVAAPHRELVPPANNESMSLNARSPDRQPFL